MDEIVDQSDLLLERLLATMGKADAAEAERTNLNSWLRSIKTGYEVQTDRITSINNGQKVIDPKRELLQKLLAILFEASELRKQLGERKKDIQKAGALCVAKAKPRLPMDEFKRRVALSDPKLVDEVAAIEAENIQHLLDTELTEYRKPPLRRLLIEPFLSILHRHDVVPSSRNLPLNHMMNALFDFVGLEQTRRPTEAGIRTIAADMRRRLKNTPRSWR
jgi:hypothetical protein